MLGGINQLNMNKAVKAVLDPILTKTGFIKAVEMIYADIKSKEPKITKKTGFNLDKTDMTENDSNKLLTAKGVYNLEAGIEERFQKFCSFPVGSVLMLLDNSNPALLFPNTTWQKQEGRFLLGTTNSEGAGETGGASTVALSINNMPIHNHLVSVTVENGGDHRHQVESHIHTQPSHTHGYKAPWTEPSGGYINPGGGAYPVSNRTTDGAGGDNTGGATPYTNYSAPHNHTANVSCGNTGGGASFSILPPYLKVNIWKRLT